LGRLGWDIDWGQRFCRLIFEQIFKLFPHFRGRNVAHHDKSEIVRGVARLVIFHHLLLGEVIVDID
jgi:hypothetical protein